MARKINSFMEKPFESINRYKISKRNVSMALLAFDAILVSLIIAYVPYTKIDWDAYMSQVDGFLGGEWDYTKLEGDTGPLVYPAGFLYIYSGIKFITGGQVYPAQILFGILYILNLAVILLIYTEADVLPWWALCMLCLSKRVHSIFVLRLFNDCFAMTLLNAAVLLVLHHKWHLALLIFSGAVSVKMNVLLFAPPLFLLMLKEMSIKEVLTALIGAGALQVLLGLPFYYHIQSVTSQEHLILAVFSYISVNFKFVPEELFVSKPFAVSLLILHLSLLLLFAQFKWSKYEGGLLQLLCSRFSASNLSASSSISPSTSKPRSKILSKDYIVTVMFVGNFIGVVCARSLHYQFYSWYFYSLPYLLWKTPFPTIFRLVLFGAVELCWNIYPSNFYSSMLLCVVHLCILWGLLIAPNVYPYMDQEPKTKKKE